jgi:hypothetical protein
MKAKRILSIIAIVSVYIFLFSCILTAQNTTDNPEMTASGNNTGVSNESSNGYWSLTATNTEITGGTKEKKWSGNSGDISIAMKWVDGLTIQHSISCRFKWIEPPREIRPGNEVRMSGTYMNTDYSTTNKVLTGLNIVLDKIYTGQSKLGNEPYEIVKISRDNKNYENETKTGFVEAPKTGSKDSELKLSISCYAGSTKYTTSYTYSWVGAGD